MSSPTAVTPTVVRPLPAQTPESAPFWTGMRDNRLMLQHCAKCGAVRHYPRPVCPYCLSMESKWQEASLGGMIHAWTVCHHPFNAFFKETVPYIVVLVDMDAGVRINAPLRGLAEADLAIGKRVRMCFEVATEDVTLPFFVKE